MTDDIVIYRSAKVLIDHYGDEAANHAAKMAEVMAAKIDITGYTKWKLIRAAIDKLQVQKPAKDSTVH
ncbi:MAG: hypothetical protein VCF07_09720 [Nitrospinota bacterium]